MEVEFTNPSTPQIDLTQPDTPQADPIDVTNKDAVALPEGNIAQRSAKWDYGMGSDSPGREVLGDQIRLGTDKPLREHRAALEELAQRQAKLNVINQIASARKGPVSEDEMSFILGLKNVNEKVPPEVIMEHEYGRKFASDLAQAQMIKDHVQAWNQYNPDAVNDALNLTSNIVSKREMFLKEYEGYHAKFQQLPWFTTPGPLSDAAPFGLGTVLGSLGAESKVGGFLQTNAVPFASWARLAMGLGEMQQPFPGGILENRVKHLNSLPLAEAQKEFKRDMEDLWSRNPTDAMRLAEATISYSSSQQMTDNIWGSLDLYGVVHGVAMGMQGEKAAMGLTDFGKTRGMPKLPEPPDLLKDFTPSGREVFSSVQRVKEDVQVAKEPRSFTLEELNRGRKGLGLPEFEPQSFKPTEFPSSPKTAEVAKELGLRDIERMKAGLASEGVEASTETIQAWQKAWSGFERTLKDTTNAAIVHPDTRIETVLSGLGDVENSAKAAVTREAQNIQAGRPSMDARSMRERLLVVYNSDLTPNPGSFSREFTTRLSEEFQQKAANIVDTIAGHPQFNRMPEATLDDGLKAAAQRVINRFPKINDAIMDVRYVRSLDNKGTLEGLTNTNKSEVVFGLPNAKPFTSANQAEFYGKVRYKLGAGNFEVEPHGAGFTLVVRESVDEIDKTLKAGLAIPTENQSPVSWKNFIGLLRTSKDTLPQINNEARNLTTHVGQVLNNLAKDLAEPIGKLSKDEYKNMNKFFTLDRDFPSPIDGSPGRFFDTIGGFESEYRGVFGRNPSEKEVQTYFSYRMLNDTDFNLRQLSLYKDIDRMGVKNWRFRVTLPETEKNPKSTSYSPYIYGKEVQDLPNHNAGVYFMDNSIEGGGKYYRTNDFKESRGELLAKIREGGHKIIQLAQPTQRPLAGHLESGGDIINFVVSKEATSSPLVWDDLLPYNPGGHRVYAPQHYVKQAIVSRSGGRYNYEGDVTLFGQESRAETQQFAKALNESRELLRSGNESASEANLTRNLPLHDLPFSEFKRRFDSGAWNLDEPFVAVKHGESLGEPHFGLKERYSNPGQVFHNEHNSPYNLFSQVDKEFLGSRDPDLKTIKTYGTEADPLFHLETARLVDPLTTMHRSATSIINSRMMGDYKQLAVESWLEQHHTEMGVGLETLRQNPLYWIHNPVWNKGADAAALATAKVARKAILNFLGEDSPDVKVFKWIQQKITDGIYETLGQKASDQFAANTVLNKITDPGRYARAIATHEKLGLFNPVQYLNQAQTVFHSSAVAGPTNGIPGTFAAVLSTRLGYTEDPAIIDKFAGFADKFYGKQNFLDAMSVMERTGWNKVQKETAWRDDVKEPSLIMNKGQKFLDAGLWAFKEGERLSRETAMFTAFREWRKANPNAPIDDRVIAKLLDRADTLNVNMTASSMAPIQTGVMSMPLQFWTYQIHLAEQLLPGWSSRLTPVEKARAFASYGALYGLPIALGTNVALWPMYDTLRQTYLEADKPFDGTATDLAFNGLSGMITNMVMGKEYSISQRFGPQGQSTIRDLLHGDKKWYELLWGVSGSGIADIYNSAAPVAHGVAALLKGQSSEYPLVAQDLQDTTRNISTVNNALKAYYALNYGKQYTKADNPLTNVDKRDAAMLAMGVQRQDVADMFLMQDSIKMQKNSQNEAEKEIRKEITRALDAAANKDEQASTDHLARARFYFKANNFMETDKQRIFAQTMKEYGNRQDKIEYDFFTKILNGLETGKKFKPTQQPGR